MLLIFLEVFRVGLKLIHYIYLILFKATSIRRSNHQTFQLFSTCCPQRKLQPLIQLAGTEPSSQPPSDTLWDELEWQL